MLVIGLGREGELALIIYLQNRYILHITLERGGVYWVELTVFPSNRYEVVLSEYSV